MDRIIERIVIMSINFSEQTLEERIATVDARLNDPVGRIRTVGELIDHRGQPIFIVSSPIAEARNVSNSYCFEWKVGSVEDSYGKIMSKDDVPDISNRIKYLIYHHDDNNKAMECKDTNIIPNNYNNHAVFHNYEDAQAYMVLRRMSFAESAQLKRKEQLKNIDKIRIWLTREEIELFVNSRNEIENNTVAE